MFPDLEQLSPYSVMGELVFQLHSCLLAGERLDISPRSVLIISSCLTYLERNQDLPPQVRELCQNLRDDWRQHLQDALRMEEKSCVA